jgi:3-polyprenyl-4-hydroxybenzoate decarboxylase
MAKQIIVSGRSDGGSTYAKRILDALLENDGEAVEVIVTKGDSAIRTLSNVNKNIQTVKAYTELVTGKPCEVEIVAKFGRGVNSEKTPHC